MNTTLKDKIHIKGGSLLVSIVKIHNKNNKIFPNKRGVSLPLERLGFWIFILITMVLILAGLGIYVFPKFSQMVPKLFG